MVASVVALFPIFIFRPFERSFFRYHFEPFCSVSNFDLSLAYWNNIFPLLNANNNEILHKKKNTFAGTCGSVLYIL